MEPRQFVLFFIVRKKVPRSYLKRQVVLCGVSPPGGMDSLVEGTWASQVLSVPPPGFPAFCDRPTPGQQAGRRERREAGKQDKRGEQFTKAEHSGGVRGTLPTLPGQPKASRVCDKGDGCACFLKDISCCPQHHPLLFFYWEFPYHSLMFVSLKYLPPS